MSGYAGNIGDRIEVDVLITNEYCYEKYFAYQTHTHTIYIMEDSEGNTFKWDTTSVMGREWYDKKDEYHFEGFHKGDKVKIKGTVKEHKEYKDVPQTVLNRCKATLIEKGVTQKQIQKQKKEEQLQTITPKDIVWTMPYKQYKEHYADCETLAGSYDNGRDDYGHFVKVPTITVIIREGRLKNSGTRFQHFAEYWFKNSDGEEMIYRAVCEENAYNRCCKDTGRTDWILDEKIESKRSQEFFF